MQGYRHDTMLQSYVLEAHKPHGLESLAERHLGRQGLSYEDLCGKGAHQIPFAQVDVDKAAEYSGEDSEMALQVHHTLWPQIEADAKLRFVYEHIEMPTCRVLQRIERTGVLIDAQQLAQQSKDLGERMVALEQQAYALAGQPFNLGSPKQIGEILFGKLGLPVVKKTASGAPSTDEEVLEKLAEDHPLPQRMLEHRSLAKLKGTYTDKLPLMVNPHTGRVHTNYAQAVAITGRLASNDPNLQNIPIRTAEGRRVREAFVAPPGHVIMSADYSQIELRMMAHISGDAGMQARLRRRRGHPPRHRGRGLRRAAGRGERRAAALCQDHQLRPDLRHGRLRAGAARWASSRRRRATTSTATSRASPACAAGWTTPRRAPPNWATSRRCSAGASTCRTSAAATARGARGAERQAINAPMQGTAADLIKLAMIAVQDALDREQRATRMVMQVHDELVFEVPRGRARLGEARRCHG